jgi:YD repeat-containing protein
MVSHGCCDSAAAEGTPRLTRLTRVTDPAAGTGPTWSFDYSTPFQTRITDPNGHPTTYSFDRLGRVTKATDALGRAASSTYTPTSYVASVTDPMNATARFAYDARDNLTKATAPTGAAASFAYDDPAHPYYPSSATSPQGNRVAYTYDGAGNLSTAQNALPAQNQLRYTYNPNGGGSGGFRTPIPIESVHRFRGFRTPVGGPRSAAVR